MAVERFSDVPVVTQLIRGRVGIRISGSLALKPVVSLFARCLPQGHAAVPRSLQSSEGASPPHPLESKVRPASNVTEEFGGAGAWDQTLLVGVIFRKALLSIHERGIGALEPGELKVDAPGPRSQQGRRGKLLVRVGL